VSLVWARVGALVGLDLPKQLVVEVAVRCESMFWVRLVEYNVVVTRNDENVSKVDLGAENRPFR